MLFPRLLWRCDAKLFDFLKLVDSEDTPCILAVGSCLLPETGRKASIAIKRIKKKNKTLGIPMRKGQNEPEGKDLGVYPLIAVIGRNRLLRGSDKVLILLFVTGSLRDLGMALVTFIGGSFKGGKKVSQYLVEFFIKLGELSGLCHGFLVHEERSLKCSVTSLGQEVGPIRNYGKIQSCTNSFQKVASVTCHFLS